MNEPDKTDLVSYCRYQREKAGIPESGVDEFGPYFWHCNHKVHTDVEQIKEPVLQEQT
jgi:hypothetical protein